MRRLERRTLSWALLDDLIPLYPLYALLFAHSGLRGAAISALFTIWSLTSVVAEVPCGVLADRLPRRLVIAAGELVRAGGYLLWTVWPGFCSFAAGFVLWSVGGSCTSGALEALLCDELAAADAEPYLGTLLGRVRGAGLIAQLPDAALATVLFAIGGYPLAGWVSVATTLAAAVAAARLPEAPRRRAPEPYLATLRAGARAVRRPAVLCAVTAAALVTGLDALEEYTPLLASGWGVPAGAVPIAVLVVPLCGALGAAVAGRRRTAGWALLALAGGGFAAAAGWGRPAGIVVVAVSYGLYRLVLVRVEVRLQERIEESTRATVTSVAALAGEVTALLVYAAWTLGGLLAVALLTATVAVAGALLGRIDFLERKFDS